MRASLTSSALLATLCGALAAQSPDLAPGQPTHTPSQSAGPARFTETASLPRSTTGTPANAFPARTPIHTQQADPQGGAYGVWAAGTDYKVSFHDGFTFIPYLGSGYPHNQPLSWRTTRVAIGGQEIVDVAVAPAHSFADYRYEYSFAGGAFVEAYDVLAEGAEQTFTLAQRPVGDGDLVIEGRITTAAMDAMRTGDRHDRITFFDGEGRALVHYGEAFALDAGSDRVPVTSSFDGTTIRLRVPGDWLRSARFPVTVDPLLTRECVAFWAAGGLPTQMATTTDIGRDDSANQPAIVYTRNTSAGDGDLWVWLFDDDTCSYAGRHQIYTDLGTWDTTQGAIAFQGGAAKWVVAFTRVFSPSSSGIRVHLHASGDTTLTNSVLFVTPPAGMVDRNIDVGGTRAFVASTNAMLVFERTTGMVYSGSTVQGAIVDAATGTIGAPFPVSSTLWQLDRRAPAINQVSAAGGDGWFVVWQQYFDDTTNDDWDLLGARLDDNGNNVVGTWVVNNAVPSDTHRQQPKVEGLGGRYLVTFTTYAPGVPLIKETSGAGETITAERVDWPITGSVTNGTTQESVRNTGSRRWVNTGLAFDDNSATLWYAVYDSTVSGANYAATLSSSAGTLALDFNSVSGVVFAATAATYNNDLDETLLSYGSDQTSVPCGPSSGSGQPVYSQILPAYVCPISASETIVSRPTHIPGSTSTNGVPYLGKKAWNVFASDPTGCVPRGASVFYLFGAQSTVPGPAIGGWGCGVTPGEVNCFAGVVLLLPGAATWDGSTPVGFAAPIDISSDPIFCGAGLCVQPLFATVKTGVDICELLEVTIGV